MATRIRKKEIKLSRNKIVLFAFLAIIFVAGFFLFFEKTVLAIGPTTGNIDPANNYAWSENAGWIDFRPGFGGVNVADSALTGYAWGENIGWVSMNCINTASCGAVNYKVANNGSGHLSGYAWSENSGWINFNPPFGGVTINASGDFLGYAWGENIGWIVFNCAATGSCGAVNYKVNTTWRPITGGGGSASVFPSNYSLTIDNGLTCTTSNNVDLIIQATDADKYVISNDANFFDDNWQTFTSPLNLSWTLADGDGSKTVYVLLKSITNDLSPLIFASINVNAAGCVSLPPVLPEPPAPATPEPPVFLPPVIPPPTPLPTSPPPASGQSRTNQEKLNKIGENCEKLDCSKLVLKPYIVNPIYVANPKLKIIDFDNSQFVKVKKLSEFQQIVYFEDNGRDWDYNDAVFKLDWQYCKNLSIAITKHDALWHHQVKVKIFYDNNLFSDALLWPDDSLVPLNSAQTFDTCQLIWY